ncbi:hypothetical protein [Bosea vaviloviae]|uniref:DUF4149 domain-containing protein n=1 Tax=Bosea vaviloviae TaxID=1526658 RepID=A0A1D7U7F9_9HYPH|nr:hypothetical protein [Bosea vaviloviae]AOO83308.1 hypothetical protein BHK69_25240 [Bosea vaviloviae]
MTSDAAAFFAIVILMLPMAYLLLAAPGFLFFKLDIPQVARLLRGMFHAYFLTLTITSVIGTVAFAVAGRRAVIIGVGVLAFTVSARRWFLQRMDPQIDARPADAARQLRWLHCGGMLFNAIELAIVASSVPYIMDTSS